jgi:hypothetical protein
MNIRVEFLHPCCNWQRGDRETLEVKRAEKVIRTGYARAIPADEHETATVQPREAAAIVTPVRVTRRTERRG